MIPRPFHLPIALAAILLSSNVFADSGFSYGAEYSEGDYGTGENTRAWYIPLSWNHIDERYRYSITVPWLYVSGASSVGYNGRPLGMYGGGGGGGGGGGTATRTASGLGDILLSGGYLLQPETPNRPLLAATAKVKLPTADDSKGLGSGETDYSLQLEAVKGLFYGYAGYKWLGDTSSINYDDVPFAGLSINYPLSQERELGAEYYTEEGSVDGMDAIQKLTLSLTGTMASGKQYNLYYTAGLSDSSPDRVIGFTISSHFH